VWIHVRWCRESSSADAEILVAAGDSIFENSPVDPSVAASVTQARPSGSIREVALRTTAVTAERRLFLPDEADDASIVEFGVSLAEQILEILNTGVAEKVDAVEQVDRMAPNGNTHYGGWRTDWRSRLSGWPESGPSARAGA